MAGINSVGTQINQLMDAIGFHDSIGDAVGAIIDLKRGDRAGFIKNMNDLYEDVNRFLEKKLSGKKLDNIAKFASVPLKNSIGLKRAIKFLAPLIKGLLKFKPIGILNPQILTATILLSRAIEIAKDLKTKSADRGQSTNMVQHNFTIKTEPPVTKTTGDTTIHSTAQSTSISGTNHASIEERIMLALTGALKDNRDEMDNLLKDIEKLGSKTSLTDKDKNDLQVLQIKLQVAISRRNEMVSTLSNIMKTFNDMNMATIRNIRI